jgi:hypothetical protein
MNTLSSVTSLGEVGSEREFMYVLNAVRLAINPVFSDNPRYAWKQLKNDYRVRASTTSLMRPFQRLSD